MLSIDLTVIVAIWIAGALLMVPVLGLTLRLAAPPIIEAMARARAVRQAAAQPGGVGSDAPRYGASGNGRSAADAQTHAADAEAFGAGF